MDKKAEWILSRMGSIVERWNKEKYTAGNKPLQGLIYDLQRLEEEEREGLATGNE